MKTTFIAFALLCLMSGCLAGNYVLHPSDDVYYTMTSACSGFTATGDLAITRTIVFNTLINVNTLVKIDISTIPAGASVVSANFELFCINTLYNGETWQVKDTTTGWNEASGCSGLPTIGSVQASGSIASNKLTASLATLVQDAIDNGDTYVSVQVSVPSPNYDAAQFYSKSAGSNKPTLTVVTA